MIRSGEARRVLVAATEASVHPLFIASFQRLGVLTGPGEVCRPFDVNRGGFLMSEAAAAVCLEAIHDTPRSLAKIDQYALGGDATHLTGNDPHGMVPQHLLRQMLKLNPRIDLIHAHGTGTVLNDSTELMALAAALPPEICSLIYSHKAALGHTLGASGLVGVVIDCLCRSIQRVPGNVNTPNPMVSRFRIERTQNVIPARHRSLIHAAGFGGPTAMVVLKA